MGLLRERNPRLGLTVSATTRAPRTGETDGVSYYFLDDPTFDAYVSEGKFLEWAWVHNHRYGTLVSEVERLLSSGSSVILEIDVQGALQLKQSFADAVLVFIKPPSLEELRRRLKERQTEDEATQELRLARASEELLLSARYDVSLVNDSILTAVVELEQIIAHYEMQEVFHSCQ